LKKFNCKKKKTHKFTQANLSNLIVAWVLRLKLSYRRQSLKNNEVKFSINKISMDEIETKSIKKDLNKTNSNYKNKD
jgi:hypothetical protein